MLSPNYVPLKKPEPPASEADQRLKKLQNLCSLFEIRPEMSSKLRVLEDFETIIICDDSGSMSAIVDNASSGVLGKKKSRWDELCQTVSIITEIATALDPNGVDIYFLNRSPLHNVSRKLREKERERERDPLTDPITHFFNF